MRATKAVAVLSFLALVLLASPASADVSGPCTASLSGTDITQDHDSAGSSVHIDYRDVVTYEGHAQGGRTVGPVDYSLRVLGRDVRTGHTHGNGPDWTGTVAIHKYAWAGVGLYRLEGTASSPGGGAICTGQAYLCIEGKTPFLTVAGAGAAVLGVVGLILLLVGLIRRGRASRPGLAGRFAGAGLMLGIAVPVTLQQNCVAPLTTTLAGGAVIGGPLLLALLGSLVAAGRRRKNDEPSTTPAGAMIPPPPPPPAGGEPQQQQDQQQVYRFAPNEGACAACRNHAAHRVYRSPEAASSNRAHLGCKCVPAVEPADQASYAAYFASGRDVFDDRGP